MSSFIGENAGGAWTLFVADLSGGEEHFLEGWSLHINGNGAIIPEPGASVPLLGLGLALFLRRRLKK
ncbi:MAG: hypothetical protein ACI9TH_003209 [Kiritimatiellia bacterium]